MSFIDRISVRQRLVFLVLVILLFIAIALLSLKNTQASINHIQAIKESMDLIRNDFRSTDSLVVELVNPIKNSEEGILSLKAEILNNCSTIKDWVGEMEGDPFMAKETEIHSTLFATDSLISGFIMTVQGLNYSTISDDNNTILNDLKHEFTGPINKFLDELEREISAMESVRMEKISINLFASFFISILIIVISNITIRYFYLAVDLFM